MTKKQLIEALDGLDDDATVFVYCTSQGMMEGGQYADYVDFYDKVTGEKLQNEITIVAHF